MYDSDWMSKTYTSRYISINIYYNKYYLPRNSEYIKGHNKTKILILCTLPTPHHDPAQSSILQFIVLCIQCNFMSIKEYFKILEDKLVYYLILSQY